MTTSPPLYKSLYPIVEAFNRIDSRILIFLILCFSKLSFIPDSNEEAYFALAKQYIDPAWIPDSFSFTEWVGTRFLFQNIAGFFLQFLSFEQLTFWGRLLGFFALSFPLTLIFKELRIRNLGILLVLQIYILKANTQHFFGQEWIFGDFEGKTFAYFFILYGYYFLLKSRYCFAALFAAIASYFHILAGGWFFVLVFLFTFIRELNLKLSFRVGLIYVACVLPFIIYLGSYLSESGPVINGVDIDWVYSFYRNTHHTAPMHTVDAMQYVFPRVVVSFILLLISVFYLQKSENTDIRKLNCIATIALCMIFTGLIITCFDTNGHLLKYYLFRIAAIGAFTYYLIILLFLRESLDRRFNPALLRSIGMILLGIFFLYKAGTGINRIVNPRQNTALQELVTYVDNNTQPDDVFQFIDKEEVSFSRKTRREVWVIFKFDPGGGEKIYEWYKRQRMREKLNENISFIDSITPEYRLDYLISPRPLEYKHLKEMFHNDKYYLYAIIKSEPLQDY